MDGTFGLWDWELEINFTQKPVEMWSTAHIFTVFLTFWSEMSSGPENPAALLFSPRGTDIQVAFLDAAASEVKMGRGSPICERVCKNIVEYFKKQHSLMSNCKGFANLIIYSA